MKHAKKLAKLIDDTIDETLSFLLKADKNIKELRSLKKSIKNFDEYKEFCVEVDKNLTLLNQSKIISALSLQEISEMTTLSVIDELRSSLIRIARYARILSVAADKNIKEHELLIEESMHVEELTLELSHKLNKLIVTHEK